MQISFKGELKNKAGELYPTLRPKIDNALIEMGSDFVLGRYKDQWSPWQIELFFKWIKQNLKIKSFLGTTKNAVMT